METTRAIAALSALAQASRLAVFRLLVEAGPEGLPAGSIGAQLGLPPATLSFHLAQLAQAGLVRGRQDGRYVIYAADYESMNALIAYLTENCCAVSGCAPGIERPTTPKGASNEKTARTRRRA
jgi:ArsR family transcriptional regulator, arsenate/arsenite/antimonite-responsive transcriptional repressor